MNAIILSLLSVLNPVWRKMGVDIYQLNEILRIKLIMDNRRPAYRLMGGNSGKTKEVNYATLFTMGVSLLMGLLFLLIFKFITDPVMQLLIFFSAFVSMMAITLISDFTQVLLDVKDNYIILPRPVNDRTVLVARLLHIFIHISTVVFPLACPTLVYLAINRKSFFVAVVFFLLVVLISLFTLFLVNALYLLMMKFLTPTRFKEIISSIQVVFSILIFASYYLIPRLVEKDISMTVDDYPFLYFLPPTWFAGAFKFLVYGDHSVLLWVCFILALLVPIISIWIVIKYFAPSFNKNISSLQGDTERNKSKLKKLKGEGQTFAQRLSRWLSKDHLEKAGFDFTWLVSGRSREFRLKVYPSFGYVLVYFVVLILPGSRGGNLMQALQDLPSTNSYILLIYISSFVFITAASTLPYSEKFQSAWVFFSSPVQKPGAIMAGAFKSLFVKYFLPFYLMIVVLSLSVWGVKILPNLLLGIINVFTIAIMYAYVFMRKLPFSLKIEANKGMATYLKGFLIMIIPGSIGLVHYLVVKNIYLVYMFMPISAALFWLVYTSYRNTTWEQLAKK